MEVSFLDSRVTSALTQRGCASSFWGRLGGFGLCVVWTGWFGLGVGVLSVKDCCFESRVRGIAVSGC